MIGRRTPGLALICCLMATTAACSTSTQPTQSPIEGLSPTAIAASPLTIPAQPLDVVWRSAGLTPVSPVVDVDGVPVAYVLQESTLVLAGLDPTSGAVIWAVPVSATPDSDGTFSVACHGSDVVFVSPAGDGGDSANVVVMDVHTQDQIRGASASAWDAPTNCNETKVCVAKGDTTYVVNLSTGKVKKATDGQDDATLKNGTFIVSDADGVKWRRDLSPYLRDDGGGYTYGWNYLADSNTYLLSLGSYLDVGEPGSLGDDVVVGLDADTGAVLWKREDAGNLWTSIGVGGDRDAVLIAVDEKGSLTRESEATYSRKGISLNLARINPSTGKLLWTVKLGKVSNGTQFSDTLVSSTQDQNDHEVIAVTADKAVLFDADTGKSVTIPDSTVVWDSVVLTNSVDGYTHDRTVYKPFVVVSQQESSTLPSYVPFGAPSFDGLSLLSTEDAIVAVRPG